MQPRPALRLLACRLDDCARLVGRSPVRTRPTSPKQSGNRCRPSTRSFFGKFPPSRPAGATIHRAPRPPGSGSAILLNPNGALDFRPLGRAAQLLFGRHLPGFSQGHPGPARQPKGFAPGLRDGGRPRSRRSSPTRIACPMSGARATEKASGADGMRTAPARPVSFVSSGWVEILRISRWPAPAIFSKFFGRPRSDGANEAIR